MGKINPHFKAKNKALEKQNNEDLSRELYKRIILDVFHIEKLDEILKNEKTDWVEEDKRYENLLEDMEEWSKEEWTEEEQKAFEKVMSNLS